MGCGHRQMHSMPSHCQDTTAPGSMLLQVVREKVFQRMHKELPYTIRLRHALTRILEDNSVRLEYELLVPHEGVGCFRACPSSTVLPSLTCLLAAPGPPPTTCCWPIMAASSCPCCHYISIIHKQSHPALHRGPRESCSRLFRRMFGTDNLCHPGLVEACMVMFDRSGPGCAGWSASFKPLAINIRHDGRFTAGSYLLLALQKPGDLCEWPSSPQLPTDQACG